MFVYSRALCASSPTQNVCCCAAPADSDKFPDVIVTMANFQRVSHDLGKAVGRFFDEKLLLDAVVAAAPDDGATAKVCRRCARCLRVLISRTTLIYKSVIETH